MPELPEVETIKNAIRLAISSARINNVEVHNNRFRELVPADFASVLKNSEIIDYARIAKYIIIHLNNGYSVIWHLGMSGRVKIFDSKPDKLEKHDHIVIETSKGTLVYNDARRFGLITHTPTKNLTTHHLLNKIGLDPFDKSLNAEYLFEKLQSKKIPIKVALLDQRIINGIGNIYASEALYTARIDPQRKANEVSLKECDRIIKAVIQTLEKAIAAGGSTLKDYKKPDGSMGYFQNLHCVYNKTGQECPDCTCDVKKTGGIKKIVQAGRSSFYCQTLQK